MNMDVETEVDRLASLKLDGLRDAWPRRFGPPPRLQSADVLRRLLAWKLQAEAYGGIDTELRQALSKKVTVKRGPKLGDGARLVREWKGQQHEVQVFSDGSVEYLGERYTSLSEVARAITGTRWNGPRFFGLRGGT